MKYRNHAIPALVITQLLGNQSLTEALAPEKIEFAQLKNQTAAEVVDQVEKTGYFYLICRNISQAWEICAQDHDRVESERVPEYDQCEQSDEDCKSRNDAKEQECRRNVLQYYSQMYENEKVYESFREKAEYRDDLVQLCRTISLSNNESHPFPLDPTNYEDELLDAVSGIGETCATDDSDECAFELDLPLSLSGEVTQINDKYSIDLDLYFTAEDMADLFTYSLRRYERICSLILTILGSENISEVNDLTATLTSSKEFNYLSEDEDARDTLYKICTFNTKVQPEEQNLIAAKHQEYDLLFQ